MGSVGGHLFDNICFEFELFCFVIMYLNLALIYLLFVYTQLLIQYEALMVNLTSKYTINKRYFCHWFEDLSYMYLKPINKHNLMRA